MISTDFAPNESWDDAFLSLKFLFQPWKWKKGENINEVKKKITKLFLRLDGESKFLRDYVSEERSDEFSRTKNFDAPSINVALFLTGRSALYHLLKSLNLPKSSEILIQAFTCEAVVLPILASNLKPVYVDIETKTFSMDPIDLAKKINPNCKVLILQHTFGLTPDKRSEILSLVRRHKLVLIEDIAHGWNIESLKSKVKSQFYLLSFGRSKALSSVFGGAIAGPNNVTMQQLNNVTNKLQFPSYGFILRLLLYKPLSVLIKSTYDFYLGKIIHYIVNRLKLLIPEITVREKRGEFEPLLDKAYPNALSVLLNNQINKYTNMQINRTANVAFYNKNLKLKIKISPIIRFPLLVKNRDQIIKSAAMKNVFLGKWYDQVVAPKGLDLDKLGYKKGSCPVAEEACEKIINLPTTIRNQKEIIDFVNNSLKS